MVFVVDFRSLAIALKKGAASTHKSLRTIEMITNVQLSHTEEYYRA